MKRISTVALLIFVIAVNAFAQNTFPATGSAGIGTKTPKASALLDMESTSKGFLAPQMTNAQRNAIASPATGLLIYQTNSNQGFYYYNGTNWVAVSGVNKTLSNLTSPTALNADLLPGTGNSINLGSAAQSWKNLYLGSAVYISGRRFLIGRMGALIDNTGVGSDALHTNAGSQNTAIGYNTMFSNTTGSGNTAIGLNAMYFNTTGFNNTATGLNALYKNTTGVSNTAMGIYSMSSNTTGASNVAFGNQALYNNTTASFNTALGTFSLFFTTASGNTAVGYAALINNSTGYSNIAIGINALQNNASGHNLVAIGDSALFHQSVNSSDEYENTAVGSKALYSNTTGVENTASGNNALLSNTTGLANTANGSFALYSNTTGYWNTATGRNALYANTTGDLNTATGEGALISNTTGSENTATGEQALLENTTGEDNTATGLEALLNNTTGAQNTAHGWLALGSNTTGNYNVADGYEAGDNVTNGSFNTFIGYSSNCGSGGHLTNATALGNEATVTSDNHIVIGNSSVTSIGGFVNWSNLSDGRVKKNIKQNVPGLEFINKLQPITYNLDLAAADKIIDRPATKDKKGKTLEPAKSELDSRDAKEQIVYTGFVAQDVEKAAQEVKYDFSGVDKPDNEKTLYGLRYSDFVVPLVKAVQELSSKDDSLQSQNNDLQGRVARLEMLVNQLTSGNSSSLKEAKMPQSFSSSAVLQQNVPNPFSHSTTISFSIPANCQSAFIIINETASGETVRSIPVSCSQSQITLDAGSFLNGSYSYSLVVNGKLVDTKQMVLTK